MRKRLDYKVPGGKLIRAEIEMEGDRVLRVFVRGDFFAHPEEIFEAAEAQLAGLRGDELALAAHRVFSRSDLRLFGVTAEAIADTLGRTLDAPSAP